MLCNGCTGLQLQYCPKLVFGFTCLIWGFYGSGVPNDADLGTSDERFRAKVAFKVRGSGSAPVFSRSGHMGTCQTLNPKP